MGRRAPRPISSALSGVLARVAPKTPLAAAQRAWPRAAGAAIAAESEPVSERGGVLTIACSSSTWAEQLNLLQDDLLERLRAEIEGFSELSELRFRVGEGAPGPDRR
jgi:predicted nucleic acid-binding Zn ribbon protein